jgi:GntR family transcriptional regulator
MNDAVASVTNTITSGPLPRYHQLKAIIREKVQLGEWQAGNLIPSERELCEQYGISRMTARQSITELVNEGLLYREQGKGTFVGRSKIAQQLQRLTGFSEDMRARSHRPGARVLSAEMRPADEVVAERLRIKIGQPVFRLHRLRLADAKPLALEISLVSFIGCERLLEEDLERDSLYELLEAKHGLPPLEAEQEIEAGLAQSEEARLLDVGVDSPVLLTRRTTYTERGRPIEYARSVYRGDKYTFCTRLVRARTIP